jgi:soluble lytic murein transglycosylase-like protein
MIASILSTGSRLKRLMATLTAVVGFNFLFGSGVNTKVFYDGFVERAMGIILSERKGLSYDFAREVAIAVNKWSTIYGYDKWMALAFISVESNSFVNAYNRRDGSYGLGQLKEATAREVAGKIGIGYRREWLVGWASYNIRLSIYYMKWLTDYYNGDLAKATAAYNQGMGKVNRSLKEKRFLSERRHRLHVDRVMKKYKEYKNPRATNPKSQNLKSQNLSKNPKVQNVKHK